MDEGEETTLGIGFLIFIFKLNDGMDDHNDHENEKMKRKEKESMRFVSFLSFLLSYLHTNATENDYKQPTN